MATEPMDVDAPTGLKRKADGEPAESRAPRRIRALDPDVVNRIAAGEIIVAPVHALKELMENAVDAGSTSVEVLVKEGGLKLLQITDNGCGIRKEDLAILCERHTTSKITSFEDLTSISTYGFRGEALASISHIAHLSVTTKTADSDVAWRAHFLDGKLVPAKPGQSPAPKATAGRNGTQICVEDLFFNVPTRRRAFRYPSDEYNKIIDMVGRYAVHCEGVAFSCKKHGDPGTGLSIQASAKTVDRIRQIHGANVTNELLEFSTSEDRWGFQADGFATNANYHVKKTTLLLFINHRCVESTHIKKAIEQVYAAVLPKNGRPFVYLNLNIDPARVDVNVHPTKREVHFLNEDEIIQSICEHIRSKLAEVDTSRTFLTQMVLPGMQWEDKDGAGAGTGADEAERSPAPDASAKKRPRRNSNNLVRTDTSLRKITSMFPTAAASASAAPAAPAGEGSDRTPAPELDEDVLAMPEDVQYETVDREPTPCRLTSIKELRAEVREDIHHDLTEAFAGHTFVGVVDEQRRLAAIQGGVKLYLVDYGFACFEYCYQVGLTDFGNFGAIRFNPTLDLRELLRIAATREKEVIESPGEDFEVDVLVERVASQLVERREMLLEYFSLEITPTGDLVSIPLLIKGYTPPVVKLPKFLLRLGPYVDWMDEKACFETFLRELASFYVPETLPPSIPSGGEAEEGSAEAKEGEWEGEGEGEDLSRDGPMYQELSRRRKNVRWAIEHIFFPAFKSRLLATKALMKGGILEVADLKGLYRVFERC
ncbi:DNA mismatch repair protein hexB [Sodiomyces alkalinus F11]|uniref:DNA mismatch repair protein hexB n=1 Tax=Sodiomyces alkalinus (strain CBS 110278 / VKM F-3762 / F11) TaxID=1314773 RepID=A0A3N2Q4V9_SODAK|nr:DNA mismatch repair protein hexB [Sodiomyces alkalinus F11]ROT41813.1 DNA mismatch repair protein hexB [Sodiomyces alkalinus F11]